MWKRPFKIKKSKIILDSDNNIVTTSLSPERAEALLPFLNGDVRDIKEEKKKIKEVINKRKVEKSEKRKKEIDFIVSEIRTMISNYLCISKEDLRQWCKSRKEEQLKIKYTLTTFLFYEYKNYSLVAQILYYGSHSSVIGIVDPQIDNKRGQTTEEEYNSIIENFKNHYKKV